MSPDSTPNSVSRVLRDRHQSKSESVFKVLSLVYCVPMILTYSLFMESEKVNYEFGIESFLRLYLD
jgi:hypothetical protein